MPDDRELVERVLEGDPAAFDALFARHEPAVRGHLRRIVRAEAVVDDLLQEVFLRVWTRAEQWSGEGAFRNWLLRVATNVALNHLRSVRRRRQQPLVPPTPPNRGREDIEEDESPAPGWMVDASALGPDVLVEMAEQREMFARLIDRLPETEREVVRLAHEAEMDLREIAEELGIPEGTVKSRLHYARRQLARQWGALKPD